MQWVLVENGFKRIDKWRVWNSKFLWFRPAKLICMVCISLKWWLWNQWLLLTSSRWKIVFEVLMTFNILGRLFPTFDSFWQFWVLFFLHLLWYDVQVGFIGNTLFCNKSWWQNSDLKTSLLWRNMYYTHNGNFFSAWLHGPNCFR